MAQVSSRQLGIIGGGLALVLLLVLGFSDLGRRLGLAAFRPFALGWQYLATQVRVIFRSDDDREARIMELEKRMQEQRLAVDEAKALREENRQLRLALHLRRLRGWTVVTSEIVSRDPVAWDLRFTVNAGSEEGVVVGAAVLFDGVMVGRVANVDRHQSVVETIVSPSCRVGVVLDGTSAYGLMSGVGLRQGEAIPGCRVDFLPLNAVAVAGSRVLTSGLGGVIPEGVPLGLVALAEDGSAMQEIGHARKQLLVRPMQDWGAMRIVCIVIRQEL